MASDPEDAAVSAAIEEGVEDAWTTALAKMDGIEYGAGDAFASFPQVRNSFDIGFRFGVLWITRKLEKKWKHGGKHAQ